MIWYELPESNNNRLIIWLKSSNIVIITSAIDTTKYSVDCAYFAEKSLDIKYVFTEIMSIWYVWLYRCSNVVSYPVGVTVRNASPPPSLIVKTTTI